MLRCSDPIFVNIDYGKPILIKNIWWHVCGDFSDVTQYMISDHRFIKVEDRIQFRNLINLVMKILLTWFYKIEGIKRAVQYMSIKKVDSYENTWGFIHKTQPIRPRPQYNDHMFYLVGFSSTDLWQSLFFSLFK